MLSNMASSLILHKRITTTVAKAKELRKYIEPFITRAKENTTHNRRVIFSYLQNKEAVTTLFGEVASKVANRPGGYTRILKIGNRLGDNAEMAIIELVDYNELMLAAKGEKSSAAGKKRSRRGSGAKKDAAAPVAKEAKVAAPKEEAPAKEEEVEEAKAEVVEETAAEVVEETKAEATDATEESSADEAQEEEKKD